MCRPCRSAYGKEHYAAHRQRYIDRAGVLKQRLARERGAYLIEFFALHPCVDCGERDPVVLEFDHLQDKSFNIGSAIRDRNWQSILDEIAKCEVVCSNCHRRRTARRGSFTRSLLVDNAAGRESTDQNQAGDRTRTGTESVEGSSATITPHPREPPGV